MTAGLPGSGIGGIFYLLSALWMPFDGALRRLRRSGVSRVRVVATQSALALGIIAALYLTGISLEHLIVAFARHTAIAQGGGTGAPQMTARVFKEATFAMTFGTLAFVLFSVQVARLVFARRREGVVPVIRERKAA